MAASSTAVPAQGTGIHAAWSFYRQCAATSAYYKQQLETYTTLSLWLSIAGAVIATLGQVFAPNPQSTASKIAGIAASIAVSLAGVAAAQVASGRKDRQWVRARAAGESIKSSVYLFCASVPPFEGPERTARLAERVAKAAADLKEIDLRPGTVREPPGPLTVAAYITGRVDDQINWYTARAKTYQEKADFWRNCSVAAASVSALLGAASAILSLAPWIALLSTLVASGTAYVKGQRYESIIPLYQSTALRLSLLKDQWLDSGKSEADKTDRDSFIGKCEETMALENGAWLAQWNEKGMPSPEPRKV